MAESSKGASVPIRQVVIVGHYMSEPSVQSWGPLPADPDGQAVDQLVRQARAERGEWISMTVHLLTPPALNAPSEEADRG